MFWQNFINTSLKNFNLELVTKNVGDDTLEFRISIDFSSQSFALSSQSFALYTTISASKTLCLLVSSADITCK